MPVGLVHESDAKVLGKFIDRARELGVLLERRASLALEGVEENLQSLHDRIVQFRKLNIELTEMDLQTGKINVAERSAASSVGGHPRQLGFIE